VLPVDTLGKTIPWLPLDETARPGVHFVAFNTLRPPFNNALVRQAFAYAIDRQVIMEMARKYKASNPSSATTLTPPVTLGRDLYNEVGAVFDPIKAKALLTEAGYSDLSAFPAVTIIVNSYGDIAPGARFNMASEMAKMWKTHLGVSVQVEAMTPPGFGDRLRGNPPEIFWLGWVADFNDPDNFLREIFHSGSQYNYGKYSNSEYDQLVDRAKRSRDPAERQELYIQAERLLCETEAAVIPLYHTR
jgi:oligopeptide transport system substrate-binding protein